ncbi:hypothetical protein WICPIJ_002057 [Wickerhamomyces pijperi]|uniref:Uncharacterized protein n=1 Tax=Wickerhamomyces pijperi TaxID=599730 RepID=A0A9P8TQ78_WICPI|nr:hypothetical protein WICPIJ_002057 [Wickerhamomyces pijperi]
MIIAVERAMDHAAALGKVRSPSIKDMDFSDDSLVCASLEMAMNLERSESTAWSSSSFVLVVGPLLVFGCTSTSVKSLGLAMSSIN